MLSFILAEWPVFDSRQGKIFSVLRRVHTGSGVHTASYPGVSGATFSRVRQPGSEADHTYIKVKNFGTLPPLLIRLLGVVLNKLSPGTTFIFTSSLLTFNTAVFLARTVQKPEPEDLADTI